MMKLSPELIKKLDTFEPSPDLLASKIYNFLKDSDEFNTYEIQCFCVEFLASQLITGELKYAEAAVKSLAKDFYFAHYLRVAEGITRCQTSEQELIQKDGSSSGPSTTSEESSRQK